MTVSSAQIPILAKCFAPVAAADAHTLILGSMPGQASLAATQYYAHPRNAFWPIMGELIGAWPTLAYDERIALLQRHRIALWDVLASCARHGSLDSSIDPASMITNDITALLQARPLIHRICFNGATAEQCFKRHIAKSLSNRTLEYRRLPSTSPAHAGMSFIGKLAVWRLGLGLQSEARGPIG
jgi:double-stranded uracil-DNA glycosylase